MRCIIAGILLLTTGSWGMCFERPTPVAGKSGRSPVLANRGMVATSHPLAAQVGLDILKKGGNAIDAAVATSAAIGLMEPMSCGIGGDLFAIVWDAKSKKLYGLNANGRAPRSLNVKIFSDLGLAQIPDSGPLSWSVPGCVDGWEELRKRFGSLPMKDLLAPSVAYAQEGFPVTEVISGYWRGAERKLAQDPGSRQVYLPGGKAPRNGELFKNPALAKTYQMIGEQGRDAFYQGEIAQKLADFSKQNGGYLSLEDLQKHRSLWVDPVSTSYRGHEVWELPPPGQGISVLQMLNLLEKYDLRSMGPNSADYWHLLLEAKKLAYADRARFYADPEFVPVPVKELISKPYAEKRRALIQMDKALTGTPPGDPKISKSDTIYLCAVDKDHNCVSLIQSNYYGFGSGMTPGDLGFALQNRGCLFSLDVKHPNRFEPGKRPFHTIIPALVTKEGKPYFVFGVMGGDMQPQGHVQVLCNLIDFQMNVQTAGEAPRVEHKGSATPTGLEGDKEGGTAILEQGIPEPVARELARRGHKITWTRVNGGGYQGILIDPQTGILHGGSEARKDGAAVGW
ncbi:MAG: gamma-glutamyltransferase [Gemmataceae bacterium]|nr:gamma-glutamyltransferase [Gemmataceae bacterium]